MPRILLGTLPLAGLFIEFASGVAGTVILITGAVAGAARALAVIAGGTPTQVEWMTALGLAVGLGISLLIFALDLLWG